MGKGRRVDNYPVGGIPCLVNPVDDFSFAVRLAEIEPNANRARVGFFTGGLNIIQAVTPIDLWLPDAEHIQVRTVYDKNTRDGGRFLISHSTLTVKPYRRKSC